MTATVTRPRSRPAVGRWLLGGSSWLARGLAISTLLVFAASGVHVPSGGSHETRTLIAMTLRSGFWVAQALLLPRLFEGGRHA
jgi:hypothetical protein